MIRRWIASAVLLTAAVTIASSCNDSIGERVPTAGAVTGVPMPTVVASTTSNPIVASSATPTTPSGCHWSAAVVISDGAGQHEATVLGITNTGTIACELPHVDAVIGLTAAGSGTVNGSEGGFFEISPAASTVSEGDRVELVLTTATLDLCGATRSVPVTQVQVVLSDANTVLIPMSIDTACGFWFSQLGEWS